MSESPRSALRTLIATSRSRVSSIALYTVPIPPRPRRSTIRYLPTVLPIMGDSKQFESVSLRVGQRLVKAEALDSQAKSVPERIVRVDHERVAAGHEGFTGEAGHDRRNPG